MAQSHPLLVRTSSAQRIPAARQVLKAGALAVIRSTVSSPARSRTAGAARGGARGSGAARTEPPAPGSPAGMGATPGGTPRRRGTGPSRNRRTPGTERPQPDTCRIPSLARRPLPREIPPAHRSASEPPAATLASSRTPAGLRLIPADGPDARVRLSSVYPRLLSPRLRVAAPPRWAEPGEPRTAHRGGARGAQRQRAHGPPAPGTRAPLAGRGRGRAGPGCHWPAAEAGPCRGGRVTPCVGVGPRVPCREPAG